MGASINGSKGVIFLYKWNKHMTASLTALTLLAVPTTSLAAGISVHVDGIARQYEVAPYLKNSRTLVPLRGVLEDLGATVSWDETAQSAAVTKGERSVVLRLGNRVVTVNGQKSELDVAPEQVNYFVNRQSELASALFHEGTIDRMPLTRENYDDLNGGPMFSVAPRDTVYYLEFNLAGPKLLQNAKIRRALAYAVDGSALTDIVYQDGKFGALGLVPMGLADYQGRDFRKEGGDLMRRDLNTALTAKQLWQEGLAEVGLKAAPRLKLLNYDSKLQQTASEFIKQSWEYNLGIEVELENVPFKTKLERVNSKKDYEITVSGWAGDYNDPLTFLDIFTSGHDFNNSGYSNQAYDQLISDAKKEVTNSSERLALLHDAEKLLLEDMSVAPLIHYREAYMTRPYVKGWRDYGHGAQYDLKYVHIEGRN